MYDDIEEVLKYSKKWNFVILNLTIFKLHKTMCLLLLKIIL